MASNSESGTSASESTPSLHRPEWLKIGIVAAASVLADGLAAAWWYRKTLKAMRKTGEINQNPYFGISPDGPGKG
jgi:hypothetical protein